MDQSTLPLRILLAELERIDLLIRLQVWRARKIQQVDEHFQGLYITDEEVDALLTAPVGMPRWAQEEGPIAQSEVRRALEHLAAQVELYKTEAEKLGVVLPLQELARLFALSVREVDILLICLAPEIDLRYEKLFGYLQDDITKRRASVDLVLNLLSPDLEAKLSARRDVAATAPLLRHQILRLFEDPSQPFAPLLSKYLRVDDRIVSYLLGGDEIDVLLHPYVETVPSTRGIDQLCLPDESRKRMVRLVRQHQARSQSLILYFHGPYGVGKQTTAAALGQELGMDLLAVHGERLLNTDELHFREVLQRIMREALLQNTVLFWKDFDALLADEHRTRRDLLLAALEERVQLSVLSGNTIWEPADVLRDRSFVRIEFAHPSVRDRIELWPISLNGDLPVGPNIDIGQLATKFRFTAGQIQDAAATARNLARWRDPEQSEVTMDDLYAASRLQSNRKIGELARKIVPHYVWDDIVLPADRMQHLREIVSQIKYRAKVYDEWGFDRKLAMGKGLNALFAGASGTGKTMAADIMAGELGLDLYKIDLSNVVSKYIGETEKNLARVFQEAETSNSILFFDEADALFGKRSEVRDAHDRYANIEISYLLQRMEEYEGMVILATNLFKNLDDAFVRRMHFALEFPFPDATHRRRIWEKIWPAELPRSPDLNLDFVAERIELAGGNIRNVALAAAFFAASDGERVTMSHLMHATQREYQKMGKVIMPKEFGEYAHLVR